MSIKIECYKRNFTKLLDDMFKGVDKRRKGYCTLIPLHSIRINGVHHHLEEKEQAFLSYNHYGQMSIEILQGEELNEERSWNTRLHISWEIKNLQEIWFYAPNKYGEINSKTNKYYNELFVFNIR